MERQYHRNELPPWNLEVMQPIHILRRNELINYFRERGFNNLPNYDIFTKYVTQHSLHRYTLNVVFEYAVNRRWLDEWTDYHNIKRQHWRGHGFPSKYFGRNPDISSAEARALQLWVEDIGQDFEHFVLSTGDPPPPRYWYVIHGFAGEDAFLNYDSSHSPKCQ